MTRLFPRLAIALMMAPMMALSTPAFAQDQPHIVTTGTAQIFVVPDMARITLGVEQRADTAPAAIDAMSRDIAAVFDQLSTSGIDAKDIQTSGLQLHLDQEYNNQTRRSRIVGYVATTRVTIAVRDLDRLGGILSDVVAGGATQINSLSFDIANPAPHRDAARRAAVADARARATLYAEAAEVTLGALLRLSDAGPSQPGPFAMEVRQMDTSAVPIEAGEVSVSASVTLTYAIAD